MAIGNVKTGVRIEPIHVQKLSEEEIKSMLDEYGLYTSETPKYPIDRRLIETFQSDERRLREYVEICKYAFERKHNKGMSKPNANDLSIFDGELEINYELKDLRESTLDEELKVEIYKQAKDTQNLFKLFGANNVKLDLGLLDRAYFEIQGLLQGIKSRKNVPMLAAGEKKEPEQKSYREEMFSKDAQKATEQVSETWKDEPVEKDNEEEYIKN